jgi:hypothetical protein
MKKINLLSELTFASQVKEPESDGRYLLHSRATAFHQWNLAKLLRPVAKADQDPSTLLTVTYSEVEWFLDKYNCSNNINDEKHILVILAKLAKVRIDELVSDLALLNSAMKSHMTNLGYPCDQIKVVLQHDISSGAVYLVVYLYHYLRDANFEFITHDTVLLHFGVPCLSVLDTESILIGTVRQNFDRFAITLGVDLDPKVVKNIKFNRYTCYSHQFSPLFNQFKEDEFLVFDTIEGTHDLYVVKSRIVPCNVGTNNEEQKLIINGPQPKNWIQNLLNPI